MNHFGHTTMTPNLSIRIFFNRGKEGGGAMCFPPLLGLIFRAVMSSNQEISDSDIFLELSVIVMKYSFKLNNSEPLSVKSPKQITANLS